MPFDPNEYLKEESSVEFDPNAYLADEPVKKKASSEVTSGVPTLLKPPTKESTLQSEQGGLDFSQTPSEILAKETPKEVNALPKVNPNNVRAYEYAQKNLHDADKAFNAVEHQPDPILKISAEQQIKELKKKKDYQSVKASIAQKAVQQDLDNISASALGGNKAKEYIQYTDRGIPYVDNLKLSEYAAKMAKGLGMQEDGYFKTLLYNDLVAKTQHKIIEPIVEKKFDELHKQKFGATPEEYQQKNFAKGFKAKEAIEAETKIQLTNIRDEVKKKGEEEYAPLNKAFDETIKPIIGQANQQLQQLGVAYQNGQIPREQYEAQFKQISEQATKIYEQGKNDYLSQMNKINNKYNAQFERQQNEVVKIANERINKEFDKYKTKYKADPKYLSELKTMYEKAYGEAAEGMREARNFVDKTTNPVEQWVSGYAASLGNSISGLSTSIGFDGGAVFGDYVKSRFQVGGGQIKGLSDLLDPNIMINSTSQLAGGMTASMGASIPIAMATGGLGGGLVAQGVAGGLVSWATETMDIAGNMYKDRFAETGSVEKASKAADQVVQSQSAIMITYGAEMLPFLKGALSGIKNKALRVAAGAGIEYGTEMLQEYPQNIFEQNIRAGREYSDIKALTKNYTDFDPLTNQFVETALNLIPIMGLGAVGQLMEEDTIEEKAKKWAKSQVLKEELAKYNPSQQNQFISQITSLQGDVFAQAFTESMFANGSINKEQKMQFEKQIAKIKEIQQSAQMVGLNIQSAQAYSAFLNKEEDWLRSAENTPDVNIKANLLKLAAKAKEQALAILDLQDVEYATVTYPSGETTIWSIDELNNASQDDLFLNSLLTEDIKISIKGKEKGLVDKINNSVKEYVKRRKEELEFEYGMGRDFQLQKIQAERKKLGIEDDIFSDLPESIITTLEDLESGKKVTIESAAEASDLLYGKYKELSNMEGTKNRMLTTAQIQDLKQKIGQDITLLENYINGEFDPQEIQQIEVVLPEIKVEIQDEIRSTDNNIPQQVESPPQEIKLTPIEVIAGKEQGDGGVAKVVQGDGQGELALKTKEEALDTRNAKEIGDIQINDINLGNVVIGYHATPTGEIGTGKELGIHIGTEDVSNNIKKGRNADKGDVKKVAFRVNKPLILGDMPSWSSVNVLNEMMRLNLLGIDKEKIREIRDSDLSEKEKQQRAIELAKENGYDSFAYQNFDEGNGEFSYVLFDDSKLNDITPKEAKATPQEGSVVEDSPILTKEEKDGLSDFIKLIEQRQSESDYQNVDVSKLKEAYNNLPISVKEFINSNLIGKVRAYDGELTDSETPSFSNQFIPQLFGKSKVKGEMVESNLGTIDTKKLVELLEKNKVKHNIGDSEGEVIVLSPKYKKDAEKNKGALSDFLDILDRMMEVDTGNDVKDKEIRVKRRKLNELLDNKAIYNDFAKGDNLNDVLKKHNIDIPKEFLPTQPQEKAVGKNVEVATPKATPQAGSVVGGEVKLPNYGKTVDTKMGKVDLVIEPNTQSENKNSIKVSAYDVDGNTLGFSSAIIDAKNKTLTVKVSQIKDKYQRNGIYSKIIDEYEAIAKDKGLKFEREIEGETQASKDFWSNREQSLKETPQEVKVSTPEKVQEEAKALTKEEIQAEEEQDEMLLSGESDKRRRQGKFTKDGITYVRQKETEGVEGSQDEVVFAKGVTKKFKYKVIDRSQLQPSHLGGLRNSMHFIPEAQPKRRTDSGSIAAEQTIANNPNLKIAGENTNAYSGAPVVNKRGEVIQGNNRAAGLVKAYKQGTASNYKQDLINNAEKYGMTKEQVEAMEEPVLVRELDVNDTESIELGNYEFNDIETGNVGTINPVKIVSRMTKKIKEALVREAFKGEYGTTNESIRGNFDAIEELLVRYLNVSQYQALRDSNKNPSTKGIEAVNTLLQRLVFDGGDVALSDMFEGLPPSKQNTILKAAVSIISLPTDITLLQEFQNAIVGFSNFVSRGTKSVDAWSKEYDAFTNSSPRDIYTPLELEMIRLLSEKPQSEFSKMFKDYSVLVKGKKAEGMWGEDVAPITKAEAVENIFKIKQDEQQSKESGTGSSKKVSGEKAEQEQPQTPTEKAIDVYKRLSENNDTSTRKEYKALPESIKRVLDNIVNIHQQLEQKKIITKKGNCP